MLRLMRNMLARRIIRRRIAKRVLACFAGLDLTQHQFVANGVILRTKTGEAYFYEAGQIDVAIGRLNTLMRELLVGGDTGKIVPEASRDE